MIVLKEVRNSIIVYRLRSDRTRIAVASLSSAGLFGSFKKIEIRLLRKFESLSIIDVTLVHVILTGIFI